MILMLTAAHPQIIEAGHPRLGRLLVPDHYPRARDTAEAGIEWAADNGAFSGLDVVAFRRMLDAITGLPGGRFVVLPDVVGDAAATLALFGEWAGEVRRSGQPIALAAQDGLTPDAVPWSDVGALFVGGHPDTHWKTGAEAARLVREAVARGKWVHMGRVNGRRRHDYARALGCHSFDGSSFSKWRSRWVPEALAWGEGPLQMVMP